MNGFDQLELELRRLPGVAYVGFLPRDGSIVVQLLLLGAPDAAEVRMRAEQLCRAYLEVPFTVDISGGNRPARVRLIDVRRGADAEGTHRVEVTLSFEGRTTTGQGPGGDPVGTAKATFDALRSLGATVPFEVEAAALFEHTLGEGVVLVLGSDQAGERYGVAAGGTVEQAAARATLHALNRFLSAQTLPASA